MKSINKFDYPSRDVTLYKTFSQENNKEQLNEINKLRYKQNLQYHMQLERNQVKENQIKKKTLQEQKNKQKLAKQLQRKKQQLSNLQIFKQQAQQNIKKANQMAIIKQQQNQIKKQQQQKRKKQYDTNAFNRFEEALKKLHQDQQQIKFKEKLAQQRKKTNQEYEKIERIKANQYQQYLEEKQKNQPQQQKISFESYKKTLGRYAYNKNTDYTKTCLHNPKIIVFNNNKQQDENAFQKAKQTNIVEKQKSEQKRKRIQQNMKRSQQRGKQALLKMQRERQYMEFQKQTEEEQKKYNLQRIQAGKKNQYIGIKPTTLQQMQENKKLRSQEEFDKMFFSKPLTMTENFNKSATKFDIVNSRMPQSQEKNNAIIYEEKDTKPKVKSYLKEKQQSEIPCVSDGKYSFEEPEYEQFQNKTHSRSQTHIEEEQYSVHNNEEEQKYQQPRNYPVKNQWKETGIPNERNSNSPAYQKNNIQSFRKKNEREQEKHSFNTDEMMKKYGLKKESPPKRENLKGSSNEKKRKVVELANICQNKDQSKEQLSYSQSEEEDSLN